jgi:hypothetical protein
MQKHVTVISTEDYKHILTVNMCLRFVLTFILMQQELLGNSHELLI